MKAKSTETKSRAKNTKKSAKTPWIVAGRRDGLGERLCTLLNAMAVAKLLNVEFKFSWQMPKTNAPYVITNNIENNKVLMPFANFPLKEELFSQDFIDKYALDDSFISDGSGMLFKKSAKELLNEPFERDFGWFCHQNLLKYDDFPNYRATLQECFKEIPFTKNIKKVMQDSLNLAKSLGDFVAIHMRGGDLVRVDGFMGYKIIFSLILVKVYKLYND